MGQVLSEPVTTKTSTSGSDDRLAFAVSEMQGWRLSPLFPPPCAARA
jgi:protein phosphatase 2C family protein 2/3